jgi:hypothetical protein
MTLEYINIGQTPNDQTGDPLRTAFGKINNNFAQVFGASMPGGPEGAVQFRTTNNLSDITLLAGTYVAVGYPSRIFTSTDLTIWNQQSSPSSATALSIINDGTQFIGVGTNGLVMTSNNGSTWTQQTTGITDTLVDIAHNGTYYVAVGHNGTIIRSTDAYNWAVMTSPVATNINSVFWSATQSSFIAVGDSATILTSTDGAVWATQTAGITQNLNSVTGYNNTIVAVGDLGRILASQDLVNWNVRTSTTTENLFGVTTAAFTTTTAVAVGANGTVVSSGDGGFITWDQTTLGSPTTQTLLNTQTLDGQLFTVAARGMIFISGGDGTWSDASVPAGLDGSEKLIFDPLSATLSVGADIVPQATNAYDLGTDTRRWRQALLSSAGVRIGGTAVTEYSGNIKIVDATTGNLAGIEASTVTANVVTANTTTTANIQVTDTANIANLQAANATFANATFANIEVDSFTANSIQTDTITSNTVTTANITVTDTITAGLFVGDGSGLTDLNVQANGVPGSLQYADANMKFTGSSSLRYDSATNTLDTPAVNTSLVTATEVIADDITALRLSGDGGNITGLPVQGLVAGTNISLQDAAGIWTINAVGDGNATSNGAPGTIQFAGTAGTFASSPVLTFDPVTSNLNLAAGNIIAPRVYANITGDIIGNVTGNITGSTAAIEVVTATSVLGNLFGDVTGNITGSTAEFDDIVTANIQVTDTLAVDNLEAPTANIASIVFDSGTITATSTTPFVIGANTADIIVKTLDSEVNGTDAGGITLRTGNANGLSTGGNISIISGTGDTSGNGGNIVIVGGNGGASGAGGAITLQGGLGDGAEGGNISIIAGETIGDPFTTAGATILIQGGNTIDEDGGRVNIRGGNATGTNLYGGNIHIDGGTGSLGPGNIFIANLRWPITDGPSGSVLGTNGAGNLDWVSNIAAQSLANGTSNVSIPVANGNVNISSNGVANVAVIASNAAYLKNLNVNGFANANTVNAYTYIGVDATFSGNVVLGNVTLLGPINVASIDNGNTHVRATANSNVTFEVGGISNVVVVTENSLVTKGNLLPAANSIYDLGSDTERWKGLYLDNTIYIGDAEISSWQEVVLLKALSVTVDGQIDPGNIPAAGDAFIAGSLNAANAVLANVVISGNAQFDILGGNTANFGNVIANNLVITGNLSVNQIANGTSNVTVALDSNITFGVNSTANVMTVTDSTVIGNSFTSNNFILGDATTTACRTYWHKAITADTTPNQVLLEIPAAGQNSVDFKVIAVDIPDQNRQSSMITTVTYGTNTSYSEYARAVINTVISDLSIDQTSGNIRLLASPRVPYLIRYTVIVSIY